MRIKKTVATFVAATMLFGAVGTASAATVTASADRLVALELAKGYEDGSLKLDQKITRAEYAAIAVRALGLEQASKFAAGATKFKDVPASHWASGYVNLAVDAGIIKGYPDGTFKPNADVTYAESIAMMVRVLGYEPVLTGSWPTKYIAKASTLGLLTDVAVDNFAVAAPRGAVFQVANNALDVKPLEQYGFGDTRQYKDADASLLVKKLNVTEKKDVVVEAASMNTVTYKANALSINGTTYDVAGAILDPQAFYGLKAIAYLNKSNKLVSLKVTEEKVFSARVQSTGTADITFYGEGKKDLATGAVLYKLDGTTATVVAGTNVVEGQFVKAVLDKAGKVAKVIELERADSVVSKVSENKVEFVGSGAIDIKGKDAAFIAVFRNGAPATFADIKVGDVVAYNEVTTGGYKLTVWATDAKVAGKMTIATDSETGVVGYKLTVGDKAYYTAPGVRYSVDDGKTYAAAATLDLLNKNVVGKDVTLRLDANGQVAFISAKDATATNTLDVLVRNFIQTTDNPAATSTTKKYIRVAKFDGTNTFYEIDNKDYIMAAVYDISDPSTIREEYSITIGGATYSVGNTANGGTSLITMAELTLDAAGKVTKINPLTATKLSSIAYNKAAGVITVDSAANVVTEETKVLKVKKWNNDVNKEYIEEAEASTWNAVKDDLASGLATAYVVVKDAKVRYIYVDTASALSGSSVLSTTTGGKFAIGGGKYAINLMVNGAATQYELTDVLHPVVDATYSKVPVTYKLDSAGKVSEIAKITAVNGATPVPVTKVTTVGNFTIINDTYTIENGKGVYYDGKSATFAVITGVVVGDSIDLYDPLNADGKLGTANGIIDIVVKR